jgi:microcystin-dependent protein
MPGTPATSPNFGAPRYNDGDDATFSTQVNSVTDTFDGKAVLSTDPRLTDTRLPPAGGVTTAMLANGAVTGPKIANQTVTQSNLAPGCVTTTEILDGTIQNADLATSAVDSRVIAPNGVVTASIADGSVTQSKLSAALFTASNLPGDIIVSAASSRTGCVLCNGSTYSRTDPTYAALFAAIGTTFGAGDGSTTFAVPDVRGRSMVAAGAGTGLTVRALGALFGVESYALGISEMPSHDHNTWTGNMDRANPHAHSISDPGHAHGLYPSQSFKTPNTGSNITTFNWGGTGGGTYTAGTGIGIYATDISHLHQIPAQGGNGAHPNVQPSVALNVFIKL